MMKLEIVDLAEALVGEIAEPGNWIIANLETAISWPVTYQAYAYDGLRFYIIPLTRGRAPAVAVRRGDESLQACRSALLRFLSAMSWTQSAGAIVTSFSADALPRPQPRVSEFGMSITGDLNLCYLPIPPSATSALALALMREGRGLNHPAYAFLSFYRVLEAAIPVGKDREAWVEANLDHILDHSGRDALKKLTASGIEDVGAHLYRSGRMAIAHAKADPIINPDDAADYDRIFGELPIMRGLAELAIETILDVPTRSTVYREHLYELSGFKDRLGAPKMAEILSPEILAGDVDLPIIDVELRRKEAYPPLRSMQPIHAEKRGQTLLLVYRSTDDLVEFHFTLDFAEERIRFEWDKDIHWEDDGSAVAADHAAALWRFVLEYVGNGELHFYDSETQSLLGRVEAFIPNNYFADHEALNSRIDEWKAEAEARRAPGS